jgi:hypothetical protein
MFYSDKDNLGFFILSHIAIKIGDCSNFSSEKFLPVAPNKCIFVKQMR